MWAGIFSRTLTHVEKCRSSVEKGAYVGALKKSHHFLIYKHFRLVTDQRPVTFKLDKQSSSKVRNETQGWRVELSLHLSTIYSYSKDAKTLADMPSRRFRGSTFTQLDLHQFHGSPRHSYALFCSCPDILLSNLLRVKARLFKTPYAPLIKATQPFERCSIDFKEPLPSSIPNEVLLATVDGFSCFRFAFSLVLVFLHPLSLIVSPICFPFLVCLPEYIQTAALLSSQKSFAHFFTQSVWLLVTFLLINSLQLAG